MGSSKNSSPGMGSIADPLGLTDALRGTPEQAPTSGGSSRWGAPQPPLAGNEPPPPAHQQLMQQGVNPLSPGAPADAMRQFSGSPLDPLGLGGMLSGPAGSLGRPGGGAGKKNAPPGGGQGAESGGLDDMLGGLR